MPDMHPAIAEVISYGQDAPLPDETQIAYHAVIHVVVPGVGHDGKPIGEVGAQDYIAETLRDRFLDWQYVNGYVTDENEGLMKPIDIKVSKPYVEGTFLDSVVS